MKVIDLFAVKCDSLGVNFGKRFIRVSKSLPQKYKVGSVEQV